MIQTNTIGKRIELQAIGGGYLVESRPTNFHTFATRRFLAPDETPDMYREVSASERTKIEAADALWVAPPQSFVDLWDEACGVWGRYNPATGYFELNGLVDITYEEALEIYDAGAIDSENAKGIWCGIDIRTNLPARSRYSGTNGYAAYGIAINGNSFEGVKEVLNLCDRFSTKEMDFYVHSSSNTNAYQGFYCERVIGVVNDLQHHTLHSSELMIGYRVKSIKLKMHIRTSQKGKVGRLWFSNLDIDSMRYYVENLTLDAGVDNYTVRAHPNIYAKLTGDTTNAAAAALTADELAQWAAVLDLAAQKQITFVAT